MSQSKEAEYEAIRRGECPGCHKVGTLNEISAGEESMVYCIHCHKEWNVLHLMGTTNPTKHT